MEDTDRIDPKVRLELKRWREKRRFSLREAADLAGISPSFWAGLENDSGSLRDAKAPGNATAIVLECLTGISPLRWLKRSERERIARIRRERSAHTSDSP